VNRDYYTYWANFPLLEPPWTCRGGAGVKIKDCLENGAGICRNEALIEDLLAACKALVAQCSRSYCPLCGVYLSPAHGEHRQGCAAILAAAAIAAAEDTP